MSDMSAETLNLGADQAELTAEQTKLAAAHKWSAPVRLEADGPSETERLLAIGFGRGVPPRPGDEF